MGKIFGTDGIRGIANKEVTSELALLVGKAVACVLMEKKEEAKVVIGKDTRVSCDMIESALASGLCSSGIDVVLSGIMPTPSVAFFCKDFDAAIMISASHNPYEFNGIKIFNSNGYKLSDALEEKIENIITAKQKPMCCERVGRIVTKDFSKSYVNHIKKSTKLKDSKSLKIAFDLANGAAITTAFQIFDFRNSKFLNSSPDGFNINKNCGSLYTDALSDFVVKNRFDFGIAFDGDADRCLAVDENGNLVDGDTIMAICALYMKKNNKLSKNTVVGTIMSNFGLNKFCAENNISFISTKVGDKYVLEKMLKKGCNLGGEQSGHLIFKDFSTTGDGQLTSAILIKIVEESGKKLSELASCVKKLPQIIMNLKVTSEQKNKISCLNEVLEKFEKKLEGDGRIIVRPSGTEPLIRVMVEWSNKDKIESFAKQVLKAIEEKILGAVLL